MAVDFVLIVRYSTIAASFPVSPPCPSLLPFQSVLAAANGWLYLKRSAAENCHDRPGKEEGLATGEARQERVMAVHALTEVEIDPGLEREALRGMTRLARELVRQPGF